MDIYIKIKDSKKSYINYKVLLFKLKAITTNSFFLINFTCLVVSKALIVVYNLQLNIQLVKLIIILFKIMNNILKAMLILISVNEIIFLKN